MLRTEPIGEELQKWAENNKPEETLLFKKEYYAQIKFVQGVIPRTLAKDYNDCIEIQKNIRVISTHRSKSVTLPVFRVELKGGTAFTMRYNFYNWKISVSSPDVVKIDPTGIFDPNKHINAVYCEGFPEQLVYGSYAENPLQFTIELPAGYYDIYNFFFYFHLQDIGIWH